MYNEEDNIKFITLWTLLCLVYIMWDEGSDGFNSDEVFLVTEQNQMVVWGLQTRNSGSNYFGWFVFTFTFTLSSKLDILAVIIMTWILTVETANYNIMVLTAQREKVHTLKIQDSHLLMLLWKMQSTKTDLDRGRI